MQLYEATRSISTLPWMLVHRRVNLSIKFAGTHLYTWVERGTGRVKVAYYSFDGIYEHNF